MNNQHGRLPAPQRGAALIVVLVLLLMMTLLGLASLRGTLMEERMSANMYDRSLSFQAAEAALRHAENRLRAPGIVASFPAAGGGCADGLCSTPIPAEGVPERADNPNFNGWVDALPVDKVGTPQYFVEYMGEAPSWAMCDRLIPRHPACMKPRYRITARSNAGDGRAFVVLQSSFAGT
ncbi:pilus assembly PilX family protein [Novilysobacter spongiicola]|uniref:Type IV pilus assembly protein PilX n=1 Tax=Lysobacter spongiicola DSM 21749 TaxID=1122188 RepID=A0A1T4P2B6_9GAMM|nr:PilX N-terminal domain-containing pilus assembly protein [Lysobacter spongiicola]SJZ85477.1 type IV pilus assembly protein PilX [Lysobacter spongiicola DSM 21749]